MPLLDAIPFLLPFISQLPISNFHFFKSTYIKFKSWPISNCASSETYLAISGNQLLPLDHNSGRKKSPVTQNWGWGLKGASCSIQNHSAILSFSNRGVIVHLSRTMPIKFKQWQLNSTMALPAVKYRICGETFILQSNSSNDFLICHTRENVLESNLNKFCCHCSTHTPSNMHRNKSHAYSRIFVGIHDFQCCIHHDLKQSKNKE